MNFENLKENDIIIIGGEKYEFLYSEEEADVDTKTNPPTIKPFLASILSKIDSKSMRPTHELRIYHDPKEIFIFRIEQTGQNVFSYNDKKEIKESEISIKQKTK